MARLVTQGFEWKHTTADGTSGTSGTNYISSPVRSGAWAGEVNTTSVNANWTITFSGSTTVTFFCRAYVRFTTLTAGTSTAGRTVLYENTTGRGIGMDATNNLRFVVSGVFSGSSFTPSANTWYRLEFSYQSNSGAWEWRVDGSTIATGTDTSASTPGSLRLGSPTSFGSGTTPIYVAAYDDVAINDTSGSDQTSWPGDGKVVLLKPVSLNANGGSWTDDNAATTSAAFTAALDNSPPAGIADTTSGGGGHQVRNAATNNTSLDMNLTDYTTAGVGASDTVNVLIPMCFPAAPVSTGGKSGSFGITSNPTISQRAFTGGTGTATFFWRGTAATAYPGGWGLEVGTITYAPTVTLGNSPVARLSITGGTASRIALCCDLGMYVDYTPAPSGTTYTKAGFAKENA